MVNSDGCAENSSCSLVDAYIKLWEWVWEANDGSRIPKLYCIDDFVEVDRDDYARKELTCPERDLDEELLEG
jgi:hypothetical protein